MSPGCPKDPSAALTGGPAASTAPVEEALILSIARARDHVAFARLYDRLERPFFNLALRITGSRTVAEEATQEAWLSIWRLAATYRPLANARPWLFRIVANASLKGLHRHRRDGWAERLECAPAFQAEEQTPNGRAGADSFFALREALDRLPPSSRRILSLRYGAGLSGREIGRALAIPTRTVHHKLERALAELRRRLSDSGLAPCLPSGVLATVLLSGEFPPAGARGPWTRAPSEVRADCGAPPESSGPLPKGRGGLAASPVIALVAAVATVLLGTLLLWPPAEGLPAGSAPADPSRREEKRSVPGSDSTRRSRFRRVWSFGNGIPAELAIPGDRLDWCPAEGPWPARLSATQNKIGGLLVPIPSGRVPFALHLKLLYHASPQVRPSVGFHYSDGVRIPPRRTWLTAINASGTRFTTYFHGRRCLTHCGAQPTGYAEILDTYPATHVLIITQGTSLVEVEVVELEPADLPGVLCKPGLLPQQFSGPLLRPNWRTVQELLDQK